MEPDDSVHPLDKIFMPWLYAILAIEMVVVVAIIGYMGYCCFRYC